MKKLIFTLILLFCIACSTEDSSSNSTETTSKLKLNGKCESFNTNDSLFSIIKSNDLNAVKNALENCISLNFTDYTDIENDEDLLMHAEDSIAIYLIENGLDSLAKHGIFMQEDGYVGQKMFSGDTTVVRYLIDNGYKVDPRAVYYAIVNHHYRDWYNTLVPLVEEIDSIKAFNNSILTHFCTNHLLHEYVKEEDLLFYASDLIERGYSLNKTFSNEQYPLESCMTNDTTFVTAKLFKIYYENGADLDVVINSSDSITIRDLLKEGEFSDLIQYVPIEL